MSQTEDEGDGYVEEPEHFTYRDEHDQSGVIFLFAIVPVMLVTLVLSAVFDDIAWQVGPPLLFLGFIGYRVWIVYRHRLEEPGPWRDVATRLFPGEDRRAQMRNLALILFAMIIAAILVELYLPRAVVWLRDTLMGWTIPWPWEWW